MQTICQIIEDAPDYVAVPEAMRHRRLELIFRPLDDDIRTETSDARGWPLGFFEQFSGCLAADPIQRPEQGDYEQRLELQ
jgi:hypothetical protein